MPSASRSFFCLFALLGQNQVQQRGHQRGNDHRGLAEDHGNALGELAQRVGGLGDTYAQCRRQSHDGGVPGGEFLGGDELHAGHGDGGEHGDGGAAQNALGDGGEQRGKFGGHARQQQKAAGHGKDGAVHHPVGGDDAHVLGICSRGQTTHQSRQDVAGAVSDDAALELLISGLTAQAAHRSGGEVTDGLDGVDGKEQSDGDAGGGVKADAEVERPGQGEPCGSAHIGEVHHAEGQGHRIAEEHAQQDGVQPGDPLGAMVEDHDHR